jgi:hypothetical protein
MMNDAREKERRRWELSAKRENERRRRAAPLLFAAGLVPTVTAQEQEERWAGSRNRMEAWLAERNAQERVLAARWRGEVAAAATTEQLEEFDASWARFWGPHTPGYEASHWHTAKRALRLCLPGCACVPVAAGA